MSNNPLQGVLLNLINKTPGIKEIDLYRQLMNRNPSPDSKFEVALQDEITNCGNLGYVLEAMVFHQSIQELVYANPNRQDLMMRMYFPVSYIIKLPKK